MSPAEASIAGLLREGATALAGMSEVPVLEAEVLLGCVLGRERAYLWAWPEVVPPVDAVAHYRALVARRARGEPSAYLTGWREFWSRSFRVTPDVLIPRPETELLVEQVLARLPVGLSARVLDLGTGSGVLAVTLALERPLLEVWATDRSHAALAIARDNARRLGASGVRFLESDWFADLPPGRFDFIVANPPYIADDDPCLDAHGLTFEPRVALISGRDGLDDLRRIVTAATRWLVPGGTMLLEHGEAQGGAVRALLHAAGFEEVSTYPDLCGLERVSVGQACVRPFPRGAYLT